MIKSNLSKTFKYINANGDFLIFEPDYGFLINKPIGIDTVSTRLELAQGIDQTGSTVESRNVQPRPVSISGILIGDFQAENKEALTATIRPDIPGRLYADDLYLDVSVTETPTVSPDPCMANFRFNMLAPYSYWLKDDSITESLSGLIPRFKFPVNFSRSYRFGEVIRKQFITVENRGQVPTPFTVTFVAQAPLQNPKISDTKTGKFLLINKSMEAGERLTIRITHERTYVDSSVDGECRGALDLKSSLFRLDTGKNVLKPEASVGKDNLRVDIKFSTETVGVTV